MVRTGRLENSKYEQDPSGFGASKKAKKTTKSLPRTVERTSAEYAHERRIERTKSDERKIAKSPERNRPRQGSLITKNICRNEAAIVQRMGRGERRDKM